MCTNMLFCSNSDQLEKSREELAAQISLELDRLRVKEQDLNDFKEACNRLVLSVLCEDKFPFVMQVLCYGPLPKMMCSPYVAVPTFTVLPRQIPRYLFCIRYTFPNWIRFTAFL
jgi:hypothetical protein